MVRGRVVKVTTRILKRNWIHIKDGSVLIGLNSQPYDPSDDYRLEDCA